MTTIFMKIQEFEFNNHHATVIVPDNPNGKWIWKTEFLYAFDKAECELSDEGYIRVYYQISDMYGSYRAVRLMHAFHLHVTERFNLDKQAILFGFSRGGLYAFNYALYYPEYVSKVYLDAPVLDMRTWPPANTVQMGQLLDEYSLTLESLRVFHGHPIENLPEFFSLNIPLLLVAGDADTTVPFAPNSGRLIEYCTSHGIPLTYVVKPGCLHHPHSLDDTSIIKEFIKS